MNKKTVNILIIDDEEIIHQAIKTTLIPTAREEEIDLNFLGINEEIKISDEYDFNLIDAYSGESALIILEDKAKKFDVILCDIRMPGGIDGIKTAKKIFELYPSQLVIMISAYSDFDIEEEFRNSLLGYIPPLIRKPFIPEDFISFLTLFIEKHYHNLIMSR